jgi:DNA segregation ATPase FtsK/SpoIIIE, S-DNA-T family
MPEVTTLYVKPDGIYTPAGFLADPDFLDHETAAAIARQLAGYHAGDKQTTPGDTSGDGFVDLYKLLGLPDAETFDAQKLWAKTRLGPPWADGETEYKWGFDWARFPIGVNRITGETVYLDFKEPQEFFGMGHAAIIVGTSGSGKTILLSALIAALCLTHSPDDFQAMVFDLKGSALVLNVRGFLHVVAAMSNLAEDRLWIPRMKDVIIGEMERRQALLDAAGVTEYGEYEYLRRVKGENLEPMGLLFIIIDEFTELFLLSDDAQEFLDKIGRQGRSVGMKLILGSQRLDPKVSKLMTNVPIKIALRTLEETDDSRALLGNTDAEHLPDKPPGAGILRTKRGRLTFQTAFPLKPHYPTIVRTPDETPTDPEFFDPIEFTATGMPVIEDRGPVAPPVKREPEIGPDGRAVKQIQATIRAMQKLNLPRPPSKWLPPLVALPVDELVRQQRNGRPWSKNYGQVENIGDDLRFVVGLKDCPRIHAQLPWTVDGSGNMQVVGRGDAGKTTAITTLICAASLTYTPERVQFFVIALSGQQLDLVADLPHVGGFARNSDPLRIERMIAEISELIDQRESSFTELKLTSMRVFRERKFGAAKGRVPDDPFGEVYLVIDNWAFFAENYPHLIPTVERILQRGPNLGVHTIISTTAWIASGFTSAMRSLFNANIELRLALQTDFHDVNDTEITKEVPFGDIKRHRVKENDDGQKVIEEVIVKVRGRGNADGFHGQIGWPEMSDGKGVADALAARVGRSEATQIQVLPTVIDLDTVLAGWERKPGVAPFGISESGLVTVAADFTAYPHLLLTGRSGCGLSSGLTTLAQSIMRFHTPKQARIYVLDPDTNLLCVVEGNHLGAYAFEEQSVRRVCDQVAATLAGRLPSRELSQRELAAAARGWEGDGPEIYVLVDREEVVSSWDQGQIVFDPETGAARPTGHPLGALIPFIGKARQVGFHLLVGRNISHWMYSPINPVVTALLKAKTPAIIMDGDPGDGFIVGNVKAAPSPPGRGTYVIDRARVGVQIALPKPIAGQTG